MRGTARSSSPRGVRGRTSIERRGLDAEQGCQRGRGRGVAQAHEQREAGPGLRAGVSAWAAARTHPAGPALPIPWGRRDACELQETGHRPPKLVGISDGPEGPGRRAGRVLGGLPAVPGGLRVRRGRRDAQAASCPPPPPLRRHAALPVPTFRAAAARSPRGACAGVWVPGTRAQPELTLTLPTSCLRSSTRCGPSSLRRVAAAAGAGRAGQHRPPPRTHPRSSPLHENVADAAAEVTQGVGLGQAPQEERLGLRLGPGPWPLVRLHVLELVVHVQPDPAGTAVSRRPCLPAAGRPTAPAPWLTLWHCCRK